MCSKYNVVRREFYKGAMHEDEQDIGKPQGTVQSSELEEWKSNHP